MKKIGLTGGIGSGKSYIAKIFEALNVLVFYADEVAKLILDNPQVQEQISKGLGLNITDKDSGKADRKKIASIVFNNPEKLQILNSIIHPNVEHSFNEWCHSHIHHKYVLKEAAILFESNSYKNLNGVICVVAPMEVRIKRVIERDGVSVEKVKERINNQWSDEERIQKSDWVIHNDELQPLLNQVLEIHHAILNS
ncbi:MAG: dephospho-CoA kinase [Bacteroidia bacterium]|nr:dephospho-CoA kinase [Bacteroidia bacterium]MCZ2248870.1 dephospho-CoA kinase [Bacteroidia bacterium]